MNYANPQSKQKSVMPELFSEADRDWIQEQLQRLRPSVRPKIALKYAEVYEEAFESEEVTYRQENKARREANTRLRLFVNRYAAASEGITSRPPQAAKQ